MASAIKKDKIWIRDEDKNYAPNDVAAPRFSAKISAIFGGDGTGTGTTATPSTLISDNEAAYQLFYGKDSWDPTAGDFITDKFGAINNGYENTIYFNSGVNYYSGAAELYKDNLADMYFKQYKKVITDDNLGLRGYMLSKRSPFYGANSGIADGDPSKEPVEMRFNTALRGFDSASGFEFVAPQEWSYGTPIDVIEGGTIDISKYYVDDGEGPKPYPTILINTSTDKNKPLILKAQESSKTLFKGIIISNGNVVIEDSLTIEGSLIIGGLEQEVAQNRMLGKDVGLFITNSEDKDDFKVKLIHNPDILLQVKAQDKGVYRQVLDALKITRFIDTTTIGKILGPYNDSSDPVIYTVGRVKLSAQSVLELETNKIKVRVKNMKKLSG